MDSASIAALRVYAPRGERLGVALALMIIAVTVAASGWFTQLDHFVFDFIQRASPSARPTGVVVVGIDQASLQAVGRWPWSRRTHAQLLRKVCAGKPKVVAYDVAFSETGADPVANAELADAIRSCGNVVLPVILETTRQGGGRLGPCQRAY